MKNLKDVNGTAGEPELPLPKCLGDDVCGLQTFGYTSDQMRAYGQACAEAARQPAPALPVKRWEDRANEAIASGASIDHFNGFRDAEISDPRAALAATAAPVLSDEQIFAIHDSTNNADSQILAFARAILAATTTYRR